MLLCIVLNCSSHSPLTVSWCDLKAVFQLLCFSATETSLDMKPHVGYPPMKHQRGETLLVEVESPRSSPIPSL